jgi:hypothetical protein
VDPDPNPSGPTPVDNNPDQIPDYPLDSAGYVNFTPGSTNTTAVPGYVSNYVLSALLSTGGSGQIGAFGQPWAVTNPSPPPSQIPNPNLLSSFLIQRQPIPALAAPVQLPSRTCVDLSFSGSDTVSFGPGSSPVVMFSSTGVVKWWYGQTVSPVDRLYFLVGRQDRLPLQPPPSATNLPQNPDGLFNPQDGNNLWVSIVPQTGLVTTVENRSPGSLNWNNLQQSLQQARVLAHNVEAVGGR